MAHYNEAKIVKSNPSTTLNLYRDSLFFSLTFLLIGIAIWKPLFQHESIFWCNVKDKKVTYWTKANDQLAELNTKISKMIECTLCKKQKFDSWNFLKSFLSKARTFFQNAQEFITKLWSGIKFKRTSIWNSIKPALFILVN